FLLHLSRVDSARAGSRGIQKVLVALVLPVAELGFPDRFDVDERLAGAQGVEDVRARDHLPHGLEGPAIAVEREELARDGEAGAYGLEDVAIVEADLHAAAALAAVVARVGGELHRRERDAGQRLF